MTNYPKTMAAINDLMHKGVYPGYSVAFIHDGRVTTQFDGTLTKNGDIPVTDGYYYDLASVTKAFVTSTLLLQMVERGEIDLDTAITHWFPQARAPQVTLRHLVTHTSGLWGYIENRDHLNADQLINALTQLPVSETYNTVKYTDTGFVLAGNILEKQLGKPIADLFDERIARPLGIGATYGPLAPEKCVPTAVVPSRGGLLQGVVHDPKASVLGRRCGSAGLFATLDDCIRMVELYLNGGTLDGVAYVSQQSVMSLLADWTPTRHAGRSLGWDIDQVGERVFLRHTGFTGTTVVMDIVSKQGFILLTNRIHCFSDTPTYNRLREELIRIYEDEASLA